MIENFIEYMWYLLTTPLKKLKKALNKWYILCKVFGRRFDEAKEDILRARDEGMVATCSHEMLPVHGADRRLTRYEGEHPENYRSRIAMYDELCKLGGTNDGVLLAVKTLGYEAPRLVRANDFAGDTQGERWAEFYIIINMDADEELPISFGILQKTVRKWKEVGAKDNYFFILHTTGSAYDVEDDCRAVLTAQGKHLIIGQNRAVIPMHAETLTDTGLDVEIKNNLFYLDGRCLLDGSKVLNTYEITEEA